MTQRRTELTAELIKEKLQALWARGRGQSPESLAKIFGLPVADVKKVLGILPPPAPVQQASVLDRMFSHLKRRG